MSMSTGGTIGMIAGGVAGLALSAYAVPFLGVKYGVLALIGLSGTGGILGYLLGDGLENSIGGAAGGAIADVTQFAEATSNPFGLPTDSGPIPGLVM